MPFFVSINPNAMNGININKKNQVIPKNIIFFKADVNYTVAYYNDGKKEIFVKTLKDIEQKFNQYGFYRIHKSFLVNLEYINEKLTGFDLELQNDYKISISRRRMPGLRRQLKSKTSKQLKS